MNAPTRFPGKPLCDILGKTMIEYGYQRYAFSKYITCLFVATCDTEIQKAIEGFGGAVVMTASDIQRPGYSWLSIGAAASAFLYSLIETARANGWEPKAYLQTLFECYPSATNDERRCYRCF